MSVLFKDIQVGDYIVEEANHRNSHQGRVCIYKYLGNNIFLDLFDSLHDSRLCGQGIRNTEKTKFTKNNDFISSDWWSHKKISEVEALGYIL